MIEEIKLLIPLLETSSEGAMWLIVGYMAKNFITSLLSIFLIGWIVGKIVNAISRANTGNLSGICTGTFVEKKIMALLQSYTNEQGYITSEGYKRLASDVGKANKND